MTGFTLQRELELYAQAGIPNIEVLKMASLECAKVVGMAHKSGSVAVGKDADLILIEGDPTKDMADIRKVSLVVKGEQFYRPEELYDVLGVKPFTGNDTMSRHRTYRCCA